jgi:hypothetical protein
MKRLLLLLPLLLFFSRPASAQLANAQGWCEAGGLQVLTSGLASTTLVQASYPQCTVSVNVHGAGLATIYSTGASIPLANPFQASTNGQWSFYAANGEYDIILSGGGMSSPVTLSDVFINAGSGAIGGSLAINQVGIGSGTNTIGGSPAFTFDPVAGILGLTGAAGTTIGIDSSGTVKISITGPAFSSPVLTMSKLGGTLFAQPGTPFVINGNGNGGWSYNPISNIITLNGSNSGSAGFGVATAAGSPCAIILPLSSPTAGQFLSSAAPNGTDCQTSWSTPVSTTNLIGPGTVTGNYIVSGNWTTLALLNTKSQENIQWVDSTFTRGGSDICDEINKAYAAGPSTGVAIYVAPTTQYTCSIPIVFNTAAKPVFLNCPPGAATGNPTTSGINFINYSPTTGTAVTLNTGEGSRIIGCVFVGSGASNSTIGLLVGGGNGYQEGDISMTDISGFGVGLQFGNNVYVDRFLSDYIHDNGVNGTRNVYVPASLINFGENISFKGGSIANKQSAFSTTCVEIDSGTDIHFDDLSADQCGFTINGTNIFADMDLHVENPNGATAAPFFTFGTSCNFCTLTIKRGEWLEDSTTGSRTEFIKDISTVSNHDVEVFISGGAFIPNETVAQLVNFSGAGCCGRATVTGFQNGFGGFLFTNAVGGNVGTGWNGTVVAQDCGTTSTCSQTPLIGPLKFKIVKGSVPLVSGTPSTATVATMNPGFLSTTSYVCTATDATTAANTVKVVNVSGGSFTITGPNTVTDIINYICMGT